MLSDIPDDWQHADIDRALAFVRDFGLAVDGGAHRGVVTAKLARHFERVVAIEPGPLADRITGAQVVRAALGSEPGRCGMAPGFVKLDVEGCELAALIGGEQTIRTHRPVVMLEENGLNRRYGVEDGACQRLLEAWGARLVLTMNGEAPDRDLVFAW